MKHELNLIGGAITCVRLTESFIRSFARGTLLILPIFLLLFQQTIHHTTLHYILRALAERVLRRRRP
jgi:hypothetical protein